MANRRTTYLGQLISAEEFNDNSDQLELADRDLMADLGFFGVVNGLAVAQKSSPTLHVDVATGVAYDQTGRRVRVPGTQDVDLTNDSLGAPTAVTVDGNSKIVSIFVKFKRIDSDPRVAETEPPTTVYWQNAESYEFVVVQGTEAVSPTPPALLADGVLLADVTRTFNQTQILTANIALTGRRQDLMVVTGSPSSIREKSVKSAITALLTIANAGVASLAATTTGASGAHLIGVAAQTGAPGTLAAGTLFDRLELLRLAANLSYAGGTAWADATTNPAASVEAQLDKIISDLAAGGTPCGAEKIGMRTVGSFNAGHIFGNFSQLVQTTNGNDGALRIGAQASGGLSAGTVRSQLTELDTEKANLAGATFTGLVTADGGLTVPSGDTLTMDPGNVALSPALSNVWTSVSEPMLNDNDNTSHVDTGLIAPSGTWKQAIKLRDGVTWTAVRILIDPTAGNPLPTAKIKMIALRRNMSTGVEEFVGEQTGETQDPTTPATSYEVLHKFTITFPSAETIDTSAYRYYLQVTGETGSNTGNVVWYGTEVQLSASSARFLN